METSSHRTPFRPQPATFAAGALVVLIAGIDLAFGDQAGLIPLLVLGPLLAALRDEWRSAASVGALAVVLAIAVLIVERGFDEPTRFGGTVATLVSTALAIVFARSREHLATAAMLRATELDRERIARRRADILGRAAELLEAPPDPETMLRRVAELLVPELGQIGIVDVLEDDGSLRGAAVAAVDPALAARVQELRDRSPIDPASPHPVAQAVRTGRPQLVRELPEERAREIASSDEHLRLMLDLGYASGIAVPLIARGRTLGSLAFLRLVGSRPYDEDDLLLVREVAGRAALALDNTRLFEELRTTEARMEAILTNLGEAVIAFTPEGSIAFANRAAARLVGADSVDDLLNAPIEELRERFVIFDERGEPLDFEATPRVRAARGEHPEPMLAHIIDRRTGEERWLLTRAEPVTDESGRVTMVVNVSEDVTAVKRDEASQRFLASATKLLTSSLDVDATLEKAAWAAVPDLADWSRVDLPDDRGWLREAAVAHRDLRKAEMLREWRARYPPDPDDDRGPYEVMRTGRPLIWESVEPADIERYARDEHHAEFMREIATRSIVIVPIVAGDRVLGTFELATTSDSERRLHVSDIPLAEELGRRAGIAVENARLHATRSHIAATLQRSLLPPRLPVIPGLTLAARFRAAGEATEVGGDFYDLFPGANGWYIVMGDVTGKGPDAAALTSLVRYTMRTAALYEECPTRVLDCVNNLLVEDPDRRQLCTAVCAQVLEGDERPRLRIACAGHPMPYRITARGDVEPVGAPGTLLGAFPGSAWSTDDIELERDDVLVLFTDGVTDTRGADGRFGHTRLERVLRELGSREPEDVAASIDEALIDFERGPQRDDVALLVLRATGDGAQRAALTASGAETSAV